MTSPRSHLACILAKNADNEHWRGLARDGDACTASDPATLTPPSPWLHVLATLCALLVLVALSCVLLLWFVGAVVCSLVLAAARLIPRGRGEQNGRRGLREQEGPTPRLKLQNLRRPPAEKILN